MGAEDRQAIRASLDFVRLGFDTVTDLAEDATLEVTDLSYGALRSLGVWPVIVTPIQSAQKGATVFIFRCARLGAHAVIGVASVGGRLLT